MSDIENIAKVFKLNFINCDVEGALAKAREKDKYYWWGKKTETPEECLEKVLINLMNVKFEEKSNLDNLILRERIITNLFIEVKEEVEKLIDLQEEREGNSQKENKLTKVLKEIINWLED